MLDIRAVLLLDYSLQEIFWVKKHVFTCPRIIVPPVQHIYSTSLSRQLDSPKQQVLCKNVSLFIWVWIYIPYAVCWRYRCARYMLMISTWTVEKSISFGLKHKMPLRIIIRPLRIGQICYDLYLYNLFLAFRFAEKRDLFDTPSKHSNIKRCTTMRSHIHEIYLSNWEDFHVHR